jgi:hypothetical protein
MKDVNRQIFEDNLKHYESFTKEQYVRAFGATDRQLLLNAFSEEFAPGYTADIWCPSCVGDFLKTAYRFYFSFLEKEKAEVPAMIPAGEPIQVQATFPKDDPPKKNHRRK